MNALDRARTLFVGCPDNLITTRAEWLRVKHGQDVVLKASVGLLRLLAEADEGPAADELRDELDSFWHAMEDGTRKRVERFLASGGDRSSGDGDDDDAP
jgi:hypothetical protein